MSRFGRVPIGVKLLLSPLVGLLLTAILVVIFFGVIRAHEEIFAELEDRELPEIVELSGLATRFASVHALIYAQLIGSEGEPSEEEIFVAVRPLLFELHRIEEELRALAPDERALSAEVEAYRKRAANAVLSSAGSLATARRDMAIATGHFNAANALIARRIESGQRSLRTALQEANRAARADLGRFSLVAGTAVLATLAIGLLVALTLSNGIRRLIGSLTRLSRGEAHTEIPMLERADDLGDMARGLATFKASLESLRLRDRAIESIPSGIAFLERADGSARIVQVNRALAAITGCSASELIGRPLVALLGASEEAAAAQERIAEALREGREIDLQIHCLRKDGESYPSEIHVAPIVGPGGVPSHFLAIQRDVSERHQMEARLRQAQKMEAVGQLAAGVAHDFNNYLTAIMGNVEALQLDLPKHTPLHEYADQIMLAAERSSALTRQLLAFGRKQVLSVRVVDANALVASIREMLVRVLGEHVRLETVCEEGVGKIEADPSQIEQILVNLAVNARDAMPGGGVIEIATGDVFLDDDYVASHEDARPGAHVMLAVRDTGEGMDPATLRRVFEPFFTTKEQGHGTGLGLATVYGVVKQSGGSIDIQSARGEGTTFRIYFPRCDAEPGGEPAGSVATARPGRGQSILLAEDQEMVRKVARGMLEAAGYKVIEARDGIEALELAAAAPVDLLVTDVVMPRMGGVELAGRLVERNPKLPVLYVSGYAASRIVQGAAIDPSGNLLQKPFTSNELLSRVARLLAG
jgi:PAS domain S-box-containing protein